LCSIDSLNSLNECVLASEQISTYVARLFFSIDSKDLNETSVENKTVSMQTKIKNEFIAFFIIDEVTMIDPIYKDAFISFQLCVGINNLLLRLSKTYI